MLTAVVLALALQTTPQSPVGTIQGIVTRAGSGEPLAGVLVTLGNGILPTPAPAGRFQFQSLIRPATSTQFLTTDETGRFSFKELVPGLYSIRASREGFFGGSIAEGLASPDASASLTIDEQHLRNDLTLRLTAGGIVSGRVSNMDGNPGANRTVTAYLMRYLEGRMVLTSEFSRDTDEQGNYRLFFLPPGEYYIAASARVNGPSPQVNPTYYPNTLDPRLARRIRVDEGSTAGGINMTLLPPSDLKISGRVLRSDGTGGSYQFFLVSQEDDALRANVESNFPNTAPDRSGGMFELSGIMPGSYELYARDMSQPLAVAGHTHVDISTRNIADIVIQAYPAVEVRGRFIVDGNPTPPNFEPAARPVDIAGTAAAFPATAPLLLLQANDSATIARSYRSSVDATGKFQFAGVTPGNYRLQAPGPFPGLSALPDKSYVSDIRQLGQSVFENGIAIDGGKAVPEIQVILRNDGGSVEGTVTNGGKSLADGGAVVLVPEPSRRNNPLQYKMTGIDASGHFSFTNIRPGTYKVFCWSLNAFPPYAPYRSSIFIGKYEDRGVAVVVAPLSKSIVSVPLIISDLKN